MANYVALIRGIMPTNPNMRNARLTAVMEEAGCTDIRPVLASANLVFSSRSRSTTALAAKLEKAFSQKLALANDVIVCSQAELETLVKKDPFKGATHGKQWYLMVTFRKSGPPVFTQLDATRTDSPSIMAALEKSHGKQITTRTWNTVCKIVAKMQTA